MCTQQGGKGNSSATQHEDVFSCPTAEDQVTSLRCRLRPPFFFVSLRIAPPLDAELDAPELTEYLTICWIVGEAEMIRGTQPWTGVTKCRLTEPRHQPAPTRQKNAEFTPEQTIMHRRDLAMQRQLGCMIAEIIARCAPLSVALRRQQPPHEKTLPRAHMRAIGVQHGIIHEVSESSAL